MKTIKMKLMASAAFGAALMAAAPAAMAWTSGTCVGKATPCFEYGNPSFYDNTTVGTYLPDNNNNLFVFSGPTVLTCPGFPEADCTLSLSGKLGQFNNVNGGQNINIEISDGSVSGSGLLCALLSVNDFNWYLSDTSTHSQSGFSSTGGIPYPFGPLGLVGNIGAPTGSDGISVSPVGITKAHVDNVSYDNATSTFHFDSDLYEDNDVSTGCHVTGDLTATSVDYVRVY